jgi:predicted metal-binding protein
MKTTPARPPVPVVSGSSGSAMPVKIKVGIIICDRYRSCAGGKCFRALQNREGAFARYQGNEVAIAAFVTCGGCPGGNIEYAPEEMQRNGVTHVHFATGLLVG